jgi:hypothetical protein
VIDLEWHSVPDGYEADGYRIRRLEGRPLPRWRLEASDGPASWQGSRAVTMSVHPTLRSAKNRARRDEQDRVRRTRAIGHGAVGIVSSLICAALVTLMSHLGWFVAAAVMLFVALRSFADAAGVWLGDAWGWTRDNGEPEPITWSGAWVLAMMESLRRRSLASGAADTPPAILMLPPDPPA